MPQRLCSRPVDHHAVPDPSMTMLESALFLDELAVIDERLARAKEAGTHLDPDPLQQPLEHFLGTPLKKTRASQYRDAVPRKAGFSGGMAADISQDPKKRFRGGAVLPAVARTSDLVCFRNGDDLASHIFTQRELAFSQGSTEIHWSHKHKKVSQLINDAHNNGINKLIIVTGKGLHSENEKDPYVSKDLGILKHSVPAYIKSNTELMDMINEIKDADIEDGGKGAFYVFLKKKITK